MMTFNFEFATAEGRTLMVDCNGGASWDSIVSSILLAERAQWEVVTVQ